MKLTVKTLVDGDIVFFNSRDSNAPPDQSLGRAEFIFCPIWKRGKLTKFFIYPAQQRDVKHYYEVACPNSTTLNVSAWIHKGIHTPTIWLHFWCVEHKCMAFRAYVPVNSNCFLVNTLTMAGINFDYQIPSLTKTHESSSRAT
jgi:hypothetical protein